MMMQLADAAPWKTIFTPATGDAQCISIAGKLGEWTTRVKISESRPAYLCECDRVRNAS
jgi:hypothetical protein